MADNFGFQFPSNGKAYLNLGPETKGLKVLMWFQFPSNGKAYLNLEPPQHNRHRKVTFQFPSNGKAYLNSSEGNVPFYTIPVSFNSLQTGKRI